VVHVTLMEKISPEMVMGKAVLTDEGRHVGEVVDVGVHDLSRVKFLVVEGDSTALAPRTPASRLVRLNVDRIRAVGADKVILKDQ
jgi:sporulation protein YlmC with PRC-barrel domain